METAAAAIGLSAVVIGGVAWMIHVIARREAAAAERRRVAATRKKAAPWKVPKPDKPPSTKPPNRK